MKKRGKRTLSLFCAALLTLGAAACPSFAGVGTTASTMAEHANSVIDSMKIRNENAASSKKQESISEKTEAESEKSDRPDGTEADSVVEADSTLSGVSAQKEDSAKGAGKKSALRKVPAAADSADTVASPKEGEHLSKQLNIPVGENGLPTEGLIVKLHADCSGSDADPEDARLMVRFNPCGLKAHNSQPDSYNDGALCVSEYLFNKSGSTYTPYYPTWASRDDTSMRIAAGFDGTGMGYRIRTIESYGDTDDLWHAFALTPDEADVAVFVPMGISGDRYTGAASRFCMKYEIALEDEQNWKIDGQNKISGGYLVAGEGETEHKGKALENLDISLVPKTGSYAVEKSTNAPKNGSVTNAGISFNIQSLPESGLPGRLMLHISPPSDFENGEGGFGFVSSKTYRDAGPQIWKMPIDGKSGLRVMIQRWHYSEGVNGNAGSWTIPANGRTQMVCEVPSDGASIDLSSMNIEAGDQVTVTPCHGKLADVMSKTAEPDYDTKLVRFFHFQWSLSCDSADLDLSSTNTTFSSSEGTWRADQAVSNDTCPLQLVDVSVKNSGETKVRCGIGKDGLPNYGLHVFKDKDGFDDWTTIADSPKINVFPTQNEENSFYAAEWYKKEGDHYTCLHREASKVTTVTTVNAGGTNEKANADFLVVRRIYPANGSNVGHTNVFSEVKDNPELLNSAGKAVCPQSGKEDMRLISVTTRFNDDGNIIATQQKLINRDTKETIPESLLDGAYVGVDLSNEQHKILRVDMEDDGTDEVVKNNYYSSSTEAGFEGLPEHALVIKNTACDKDTVTSTELPRFNVDLGIPNGISQTSVRAHLYRYDESEKKWKKENTPEDSGDWINDKDGKDLSINLNSAWTYGLHAHLKDNEAMVVIPKDNIYEISYSISIANHDRFDVIKDRTHYPAETFHPNKHYFYGLYKNENVSAKDGGVLIEIGTAHKNADAEDGKGSATALSDVRPLRVNLFDYDFGKKEDFILGRQMQQFHFSYDPRNVPDTDVNTWHDREFTGIVQNTLSDDGLPVFNYSTPFESAGVSLFDMNNVTETTNGGMKTVYPDVDFDFIYDENAKSYSYTSGTNAACFDAKLNRITQYSAPIGLDGWDEKSAGFFPFDSFQEKGHWGTKTKGNQGVYLLDGEKTINYHFGMSMTHDFYIPENQKAEDGKDLIFKLSADDDAWLFIDGKLAMDLGGIHEACDGVMNFTRGTLQIGSTMSPWNTQGNYQAPKPRSGDLVSSFMKPGKHTFSIFYLERGSTLSDLTINFNLPLEKKAEVINTGGRGIGLWGLVGTFVILAGCFWMRREHDGVHFTFGREPK